jgi:hypothetical protein
LTEGKAAALGMGFGVVGHVMFVWRARMSMRFSMLFPRGVPPPVIDKVRIVKRVVRISVPIVVMRLQGIGDEMMGRRSW